MLTLNGLLGHRRELGVEFLSVHHAKPRVEGVFALGRTLFLKTQDTLQSSMVVFQDTLQSFMVMGDVRS